jgi:hypothetical protein
VKRSNLGGYYRFFTGASGNTDNDWTALFFNNSDQLTIGGYTSLFRTSNSVYRDCSAWYHLVVIADLNNANNALKFRAWINNVEVTWSSTSTNPTTTGINATNNHTIGAEQSPNNGALNSYFDGYLADIHFIDGQALTPSSFTEVSATTGQLIPLAYTAAPVWHSTGFWLKFSDNSAATAAYLAQTLGNLDVAFTSAGNIIQLLPLAKMVRMDAVLIMANAHLPTPPPAASRHYAIPTSAPH